MHEDDHNEREGRFLCKPDKGVTTIKKKQETVNNMGDKQ